MSTELERVAAMADLMAAKGLRYVKIDGMEVEVDKPLVPIAPAAPAVPVAQIPAGASVTPAPEEGESVMLPAEALCRCTHAMVDHDSSGCLVAGCKIETCLQTKV